ncbi:MAG: ABC transporter ATP-binding protein, partial [Pseudomonadota bacterium]
ARAIAMDPEIIIYDEQFVGLDPISLGVIVRLVRQMNDALGISSIVVSHDVAELSSVADRSFLISGGKVAASGSPEDLSTTPSDLVQQFMNGMADGPVPFHFPAPDYAEQLLGGDEQS